MLVDSILNDGVVSHFPKMFDCTARRCWNRDFFERLAESEVKKVQDTGKVAFIEKCTSTIRLIIEPFDNLLL